MKKRCSFCKKEIGFFVKECPYCYETQKVPILIWILLLIVLLICLGVGFYLGIQG